MLKLQVMVSDELAERIDRLCEYLGASRSSVCASIIGLALPEWEKSYCFDSQEVEKDSESKKIQ